MARGAAGAGVAAGILRGLRTSLLDGEFDPGSRINEVQLAARLGVSRTPVRAALQLLAGEGLVEYEDNRGFFVRQFAAADIIDAFEMRALAEGLSARLAAERGLSVEDELEIEAALSSGDASLEVSDEREARAAYSVANNRFHNVVQQASRSRLVADVIALCNTVPQTLTRNVMGFSRDSVRTRARQHHEIYNAILARKPREAEELMVAHVLDVRRTVARSLLRTAANDEPR